MAKRLAAKALVRLCPLWWVYVWSVKSFMTHDCHLNPFRCRVTEPVMRSLAFLDWFQTRYDES